jgi:dihydropteroate synthase
MSTSGQRTPLEHPASPARQWSLPDGTMHFGPAPKLMGIVNVTPDSFSDGGRWATVDRAVEHALQLVEQGADMVDVGGESTRPGSDPVPADEECRRVLPVIERVAGSCTVPVSIDTSKAEVAERALGAGAAIVNDVTALTGDMRMLDVCARSACGVVVMHMQGRPKTMQANPQYTDVVREVCDYLSERVRILEQAGISGERVVIDPGIGFGKTAAHNLELLSNIGALHRVGSPVLIGHSRKKFLQKVLGRPVEEVTAGTIGVAIAVAGQGVQILRVHDVAAVRDALMAWDAVRSRTVEK